MSVGSCPIIPVKAIGREALLRESHPVCEPDNPTVEQEHSHRPQKRAPRAVKAQELAARLQGDTEGNRGEAWLSTWVQLATERVLHET